MKFRCEARLRLSRPIEILQLVTVNLKSQCQSVTRQKQYYQFEFDTAVAYIKADEEGLWLRVEAEELTICHGIEMLIESHVGEHAADMPKKLLWIDADDTFFKAINSYEARDR